MDIILKQVWWITNKVFDILIESYSELLSITKNNKVDIWKKSEDTIGKGYFMRNIYKCIQFRFRSGHF